MAMPAKNTSIKKCPYCGSVAIAIKAGLTPPQWWIRCTRKACEADGPMYPTKGQAVNSWNFVSDATKNYINQHEEAEVPQWTGSD
jgi:hypothetical protein